MDIMVILQIIVLLGAIFVGVRLGGIGIGYAGGAGVLILGLCLGMKPGNIPWDVILIIASVISAISATPLFSRTWLLYHPPVRMTSGTGKSAPDRGAQIPILSLIHI